MKHKYKQVRINIPPELINEIEKYAKVNSLGFSRTFEKLLKQGLIGADKNGKTTFNR